MWLKLIIGLALSYLSAMMTPVPPPPKAATLDQFKLPMAKEGAEAGVVFGSPWIENPNVTDYGDLRVIPIKAKGGKK